MAGRHASVVVDENDVKVTSVFSRLHEHALIDENATLDDKTLGALGYKQEFKRYLIHLPSTPHNHNHDHEKTLANAAQRLHLMGILLRLLLSAGPASECSKHDHILPGIFRNRRIGLGMADLRAMYPGYCFQYGRVGTYRQEVTTILRQRSLQLRLIWMFC